MFGLSLSKSVRVWLKATPIPGSDSNVWRRDAYGHIIRFSDEGDTTSPYGWQIDHYPVPKSMDGSDDDHNLRPLHWKNNQRHGGYLASTKESGLSPRDRIVHALARTAYASEVERNQEIAWNAPVRTGLGLAFTSREESNSTKRATDNPLKGLLGL